MGLFDFTLATLSRKQKQQQQQQFKDTIYHFYIDHNAPRLPPKILHNYCLQFLCNDCDTLEELETIVMYCFGGKQGALWTQ